MNEWMNEWMNKDSLKYAVQNASDSEVEDRKAAMDMVHKSSRYPGVRHSRR